MREIRVGDMVEITCAEFSKNTRSRIYFRAEDTLVVYKEDGWIDEGYGPDRYWWVNLKDCKLVILKAKVGGE